MPRPTKQSSDWAFSSRPARNADAAFSSLAETAVRLAQLEERLGVRTDHPGVRIDGDQRLLVLAEPVERSCSQVVQQRHVGVERRSIVDEPQRLGVLPVAARHDGHQHDSHRLEISREAGVTQFFQRASRLPGIAGQQRRNTVETAALLVPGGRASLIDRHADAERRRPPDPGGDALHVEGAPRVAPVAHQPPSCSLRSARGIPGPHEGGHLVFARRLRDARDLVIRPAQLPAVAIHHPSGGVEQVFDENLALDALHLRQDLQPPDLPVHSTAVEALAERHLVGAGHGDGETPEEFVDLAAGGGVGRCFHGCRRWGRLRSERGGGRRSGLRRPWREDE